MKASVRKVKTKNNRTVAQPSKASKRAPKKLNKKKLAAARPKKKKSKRAPKKGSLPSRWIKCISQAGTIRGVAIQATELTQTLAQMHGLKGKGAKGVAEAAIGGLLLASCCNNDERVNLNIRGSGHYSQALVDAYPNGRVRGFVTERKLATREERARVAKGGPWGDGLLSVLRTQGEPGQPPYIGTVPLLTGFLAKDLTFYWFQSEQLPSATGIAVVMKGEKIEAAGGFLIQAMPGANPEEVRAIEAHIQSIGNLAQEFAYDQDPMRVLATIFQSMAFIVIEEQKLKFHCDCSWERVNRALTLVGVEELQAMLKEDRQATVNCDFCSKKYKVSAEKLREMIKTLTPK